MSENKNCWPSDMYSRETWANERGIHCRTLHACPSAPLFGNDFSERRKCLYGKRSFSTSPHERSEMDNEKVLQVLSQERPDSSDDAESDYNSAREIEELKQDTSIQTKKKNIRHSNSSTGRMSDAADGRDSLQEPQICFGLGDKNPSYSDHMYENICSHNEVSERSTSCSTGKNSVYSSDSLPIESFENCEYMTTEAVPVKTAHSPESTCAYAIPKCNCVLQQQFVLTNNNESNNMNKTAVTKDINQCKKFDGDSRSSNAYISMDSYIHMNTVTQCRKKEKVHDYENDKDWVKREENLGEIKLGPEGNESFDASSQKVTVDSGVIDMYEYVFPQHPNEEKTHDYENNKEWIKQDQDLAETNHDPAVNVRLSLDTSPEQPAPELIAVDPRPVDKRPDSEKNHDYENEKEWLKQDISRPATLPEPPTIKSSITVQKQIITESRDVNMKEVEEPDSKVNPIPSPIKEEVPEKGEVDDAIKGQLSRQSSQSFRRHGRRQDRKRLDYTLLEVTLAQQEGGYLSDAAADYDLPVFGEEQKLDEPAESKADDTGLSEQTIYLPNIHPKLINFLKSSTAHRHHLEGEMDRKGMTIVWPTTEDGILKLQPNSKRKWCPCSSELNTEEELSNTFQKYLRSFAVDDSICAAKEIFDDLSTLQQQTPLISKCTIHNERMNFTIVGDKKSVQETQQQLLALISFLELRLKASKVYRTTKTKYMARHEIRMVFESNLLDKYQKKPDLVQVEVCDKFEYVRFTGDMQTVDSAMNELHEYLKSINGQVYKCSNLVRRLLNQPQAKSLLQQLLRNHNLACAWIATEEVCIVYGTSNEDIQFVKDIFRKFLVTETIHFSQGQKGILQSKSGIAEVHIIKKLNEGYLEIETSDKSVEIACVQRIQDDVSKRIKKYLQKHEVVKTVQELDSGMFQFMQRFCQDRISTLKDHCKNILVDLTAFEEKLKCGYVLTGKRDFCKIALRDLEKVLVNVTSFEHTLKRVGLVQFLQSEAGRAQVSALESEHRCVLHYSDGSPICQSKICACQYKGKEIVVLQEDISSVSSGLAFIPCTPSCDEMKHNVEVEMPRKLVVRECMVSPDTKYTNKSNFFACLPDIKSWSLEARDALRASVELSMQEVKKRGITTIAFSSCVTNFPTKEYAKILVETIKTLLDGEKQSTKLKTMMFCAKDASHTSSFVQTLKQTFGCKNVHVSGSIRETKTVLNASNLINETESTIYSTVKEASAVRNEKDHKPPIDVNIVQENAGSIKTDAIFIPTNEKFDLPRSSSQLLNSNIAERIRQQFHAVFPFGTAVGQVVPLKAEDLVWDVVYIANIGAANSGKDISRKELEAVVRKVLDKCGEDEIESLSFMAPDIGIYLLSEVLFNAIQPFIMRNCMLERVDIVVQPRDRSSYLPFEAMKKEFYEKAAQFGSNDSLYSSNAQISAVEKKGSLSFTEGCVNVEMNVGDITKETTDAIVNSVQGNLDLSIGRIAKAVSEAAGDAVQTEIKTKQNLSKIRRDGFVVSGPGKLPCRYIFHIKIRGSIDGWKSIISVCLQQAESLGITSLSFPALGTGRKGIKPRYFSKIILKCIRRFAESHPRSLRQIRIVVLEDSMFQTIVQAANAFKSKKKRHTLKDKIHDMLKKESSKQLEDEVVLQVYTDVDNVENVTEQLNELCHKVSLEPAR